MIYNIKNNKSILKTVFAIFLFFVLVNNTQATEIRFDVGNDKKLLNKSFNVDFFVDSQKQNVNAFEAEISFSEETLKFKGVRLGGSIINLWIQEPQQIDNKIKFSGVVPGGFYGESGFLLSLIFETKKLGDAHINIDDFVSLANDGLGTKLNTSFSDGNFQITKDAEIETVRVGIDDHEKPEIFQPIITKIPSIAGDKYVLLFLTEDKNSGIAYYEVKEGFGLYKKATSPYILSRQELDVDIFIRAVDKGGNIRLEIIDAPNKSPRYKKINIYVIIYIVIAIIILAIISRGIKIKWNKTK